MTFLIVTHIVTFVVGALVGTLLTLLYGAASILRKRRGGGADNG